MRPHQVYKDVALAVLQGVLFLYVLYDIKTNITTKRDFAPHVKQWLYTQHDGYKCELLKL